MRTLLGVLVIASSVFTITRPVSGQDTEDGSALTATTVEVQNDFADPVGVFVEQGQFDVRIGRVDPLSTAVLTVPEWVVRPNHPLRLFVVHRGEDLTSEEFRARPGEKIGLMVPRPEPAPERIIAPLPVDELSETTLTVENERDRELVVYAERGPYHVRLGWVAPNSTATLEFPESVVDSNHKITVVVQPRGEFNLETHALWLRTGEHLALDLKPQ